MPPTRVPRTTVECAREGCSNTREVTDQQRKANKSGRFFCSAECRNKAGSKPRTLPDLECEVCGESYRPGQAKSLQTSRFCSRACMTTSQTKPRADVRCSQCGTTFASLTSDQGDPVRKFCSHRCATEHNVTRGVGRTVNGRAVTEHVSGYLMVHAPGRGRIMEHRYVMEQALGRGLRADEQVHHVNHVKTDNRLENLALLSPTEHAQETRRVTGRRAEAKAARIRELEAELFRLRQQIATEGTTDG